MADLSADAVIVTTPDDLLQARRHAAEHRVVSLEQRLAGLQELGQQVAPYRSRLSEARLSLRSGDLTACEGILDEVSASIISLAAGGEPGTEVRKRSDRRWRTPAPGTLTVPPEPPALSAVDNLEQRQASEFTKRLDKFHQEATDRFEQWLEKLEERLERFPQAMDNRVAARINLANEDLRHEWRAELAMAEERLRQMAETEWAGQRAAIHEAAGSMTTRLEQLLNEQKDQQAALAQRILVVEALATQLDQLSAEPAALEARLERRIAGLEAGPYALEKILTAHYDERISAQRTEFNQTLQTCQQDISDKDAVLTALKHQLDELRQQVVANEMATTSHAAPTFDPTALMTTIMGQVDERLTSALTTLPNRHEATGLVAKAVSTLPSRDDLQKLGDNLRADLDWKLERMSAENGWVTMADVQAIIRKNEATVHDKHDRQNEFDETIKSLACQVASQQQLLSAVMEQRKSSSSSDQTNPAPLTGLTRRVTNHIQKPATVTVQVADAVPAELLDALPVNVAADQDNAVTSAVSNPSPQIDGDTAELAMMLDRLEGEPNNDETADVHKSSARFEPTTAAIQKTSQAVQHHSVSEATPLTTDSSNPVTTMSRPETALYPVSEASVPTSSLQSTKPALTNLTTTVSPLATGNATTKLTIAHTKTPEQVTGTQSHVTKTERPVLDNSSQSVAVEPSTAAFFATDPRPLTTIHESEDRPITPVAVTSPRPSTSATTKPSTTSIPAQHASVDEATLRTLIKSCLAEHLAQPAIAPSSTPISLTDTRRCLPDWLQEEPMRTAILGIVASEALFNPGALAELTGLRKFLQAEVARLAATSAIPE